MPKLTEIMLLRQKPQMQLGSSAVAQMQVYLILKHVYITYHTRRLSTIDRKDRVTKIIFLKTHFVSQFKIVNITSFQSSQLAMPAYNDKHWNILGS